MYLKKIEISGFKSFARKTVLEFDRGIISVVGPNGSGKSNFSDAIRWVLGEQSMKAVRSKKSEDVIFAGSDKKSRLGMAECSIIFDNEDRRLPLDFSEVAVSRRLFRDGESEYLINARPVRLMDIVELLSKSGYGNSSYQVISQGTIDQLVISGAGAIKTVIEEASGVKPYYMKRERSLRKLDRSEENLRRVADLVAEIEPRLRSLRRQAKRMEARDEIVGELRGLQEIFFASSYQRVSRELAEFENRIKFFDKEIGGISSEAAELERRIKILEAVAGRKTEEYAGLQGDLRKLEKEKNQIQEELAIIRGRLKARVPAGAFDQAILLRQQRELNTKIAAYEGHVSDLRNHAALHEKNSSQHRKIFQSLGGEIEKIKKQLELARSPMDLNRLRDDAEKVYSRYQSLVYQIKNFQSEVEIEHLQEDAGNLEILLLRLKDRITQVSSMGFDQSQFLGLNSELVKIFSQKEKLQAEISAIESEISAARSKQQFYAEAIAAAKSELNQMERGLEKTPSENPDDEWKELERHESEMAARLQEYFSSIQKMESDLKNFVAREAEQKKELLELERAFRNKQDLLSKTKDQRGMVLIEKARVDAVLENVLAEARKSLGNEHGTKIKEAPIVKPDPGAEQKIARLKAQLEAIGGVDELTLQEYRETEKRYNYLTGESQDLRKAVDDLRKVIAELDLVIKRQFQDGFNSINEHFSEYFRILFSGGRARMNLVKEQQAAVGKIEGDNSEEESGAAGREDDGDDTGAMEKIGKEEVTGVEIRATPPGKKLTSLSALSGGERTLTSIALLMAILSAFPSPFVVLDEVDAALDEANSIRFGKILSRLSHQTQFITITHNRETMRQAGMIYGITMGDDGISKVLSIKLDKAVEIAA